MRVSIDLKKPLKALFLTVFLSFAIVSATFTLSTLSAVSAQAAVVSNIEVRGNTRMDSQTVISFLTIKPGQKFDNGDIDDSVKALFTTGLFGDVAIYQSGSTLVVEVDENATINEVFFEGNKRLKDEPLSGMVQSRSRGIYSPETVSSDVDIIREAYSRVGRSDAVITSEIVPLANNRVNIVYRVNEGGKTKIKSITFVGNNAFRSARLAEVISTKRSNFMSWLKNDDIYDPDRIAADEERLRRYYFNNGFADFQILSTSAVLDEVENQYNVTITIEEGSKYRFGDIQIESTLAGVDANNLYNTLETKPGKVYSAKDVEDTIIALSESVAADGFAFVEVVPRGDRNFSDNTINVTYIIDEGAKVFVDRIIIVGNERTRDYVIRREFDLSEGDAFNQVYVQQAKRRLEALGIFETVDISVRQGDFSDRVAVVVRVAEKATGEFSIGGGYSTAGGALGEISFTESNFMGRGQKIRISGSFGEQEESYRLSFTEPYFLGYRMSAGFDVGRTTTNSNSDSNLSSQSTFGNIRFGLPLTENTGLGVFYTFSDTTTSVSSSKIDSPTATTHNGIQGDLASELSAALAPPLSPSDWIKSGIGYNLTHSTLDDAITPREGFRAEFGQTVYGIGGDATYLKSEAKAQLFMTVSEDFDIVGMVRGRVGANTSFGNDSGYRALDNFFQGGNDIRGFRSNGFGPRDPVTGDALGGMYYWNATAEVNFPIPLLPESAGIRGAVFADAGSLWGIDSESADAIDAISGATSVGDIHDNSMRASVGASIIWNSPFGPLRFDYAEPVVSQSYDKIREFSFGVSTSF